MLAVAPDVRVPITAIWSGAVLTIFSPVPSMVRHLDGNSDHVDVWLDDQLLVVSKHCRDTKRISCCARRFLAARADRSDLVVRQRAQRRDMGGGRPPPGGVDPDDPDTQRPFRGG